MPTARLAFTLVVVLLAGACDETTPAEPTIDAEPDAIPLDAAAPDAARPPTRDPFDPVGEPVEPEAPPPAPPVDVPPEERLALDFVPVQHDSGALRLTGIAFLPGDAGDFLVLDKDGEVIHMRMGPDELDADGDVQPTAVRVGGVWLDEVYSYSDAGLISVAVDPRFETNRFIYLGFTADRRTSVIKRYTLDLDDLAGLEATGVDVLRLYTADASLPWHNVGSIGFTETGEMWAPFGDKKLPDLAQDITSPLGSLLRFAPSSGADGGHVLPDDNPFGDGSGHPAIYATGLRSPWTGLYHDGVYFVSDVGRDSVEEINRIAGPAVNLGWPRAEGPCVEDCAGLTDPWVSWPHDNAHPFVQDDVYATSSSRRSGWTGWIYDPSIAPDPDPYQGRWNRVITYGDAFVGFVRAASIDADSGAGWHVGHVRYATDWAQGPDGYVYVVAIGRWPAPEDDIDAPPAPIYRAVLAPPRVRPPEMPEEAEP